MINDQIITILDNSKYLFLSAFVIRTLRNGFYHVFLWQLKEYRLDRYLAHLKTPVGRRLIFGLMTILKWIPLIVLILISVTRKINSYVLEPIRIDYLVSYLYFFFFFLWTIEAIFNLGELIKKGWHIPKFTPKAILIVTIAFIIQFNTLFMGILVAPLILGPFLDKMLSPSVFILVLLFNIPSSFVKQYIVYKAKRKIENHKNLLVIGITGSYGKTSTKEFLSQILNSKYNVCKTPLSLNTEIGIADFINKNLSSSHEVFIVEMGAYKKGEIAKICNLVKPVIGIITGIGNQHIELFGSIENIIKTKFELIRSLPDNGFVIFNGESSDCLRMSKEAKKKRISYSIVKIKDYIKNYQVKKDYLQITISLNGRKYTVKPKLLGAQNLQNIVLAVRAAFYLRTDSSEIVKSLNQLESPAQTMKIFKKLNKSFLVDDTFNTTFEGVIAALKYMNIFEGKKIMILTPLIESGHLAKILHRQLGKECTRICDLTLLTNRNYFKEFIFGISTEIGRKKVHLTEKMTESEMSSLIEIPNSVIVFEGKEGQKFMRLY